jgi:hypothetical protein
MEVSADAVPDGLLAWQYWNPTGWSSIVTE